MSQNLKGQEYPGRNGHVLTSPVHKASQPNSTNITPLAQTKTLFTPVDNNHVDSNNLSSDERGNDFFSQLDSMIQAVKVESSALDSMHIKCLEVDTLRNQLNTTKQMLSEKVNELSTLKDSVSDWQEKYTECRKSKNEIESTNVALVQELSRTKDTLAKEKSFRSTLQQENTVLKENITAAEKKIYELMTENKMIPALQESNSLLKNDLNRVKNKFKEENNKMIAYIKELEEKITAFEGAKVELRSLAMKLVDLSNCGNSSFSAVDKRRSSGGRIVKGFNDFEIQEDDFSDDEHYKSALGGEFHP